MEHPNVRKLILLVMLIVLVPGSIVFGQGPPKGTPEGRAVELRNLLDSIEGVSEEPSRQWQSNYCYFPKVVGNHLPDVEE